MGTGVVADFDERRGLGSIAAENGGSVPFHCTAIADGTRRIAEATTVRYRLVPGRSGRWEAGEIVPC